MDPIASDSAFSAALVMYTVSSTTVIVYIFWCTEVLQPGSSFICSSFCLC